jgi:hypothetical protein
MARNFRLLACLTLLGATAAHARFGKKSEPESETHSAESANPEHKAESVGPSSSGDTHSASSVPSASSESEKTWLWGLLSPSSCGYWSGAYVPWFGYGFRRPAQDNVISGPDVGLVEEEDTTRLVAGVESQFFGNGFTIGAGVGVEFGRVGISFSGANIAVKADDGTDTMDNLQQVTARLSFAFLTGRYGRLRAEVGADAIFAPDLIVVGPTVGMSGTVWITGPLAAEGSAYWTFYPYDQVDLRLGAAVGIGPLGMRLGWRFQVLSDRGLVDGNVHTDIFTGPYTGLSLAL